VSSILADGDSAEKSLGMLRHWRRAVSIEKLFIEFCDAGNKSST